MSHGSKYIKVKILKRQIFATNKQKQNLKNGYCMLTVT